MTTTLPGVTVRLAQLPEDMPAIVAVRRRVFIEEQGVATSVTFDVNDRLASHVVGLVDHQIVGIGRLQITGQEAQIAWVAVLRDQRRHGVGRAIVRRLVELADAAGVELTLLNAQTHALAFYEHFGFRPVGTVFIMGGIEHQMMSRRRP